MIRIGLFPNDGFTDVRVGFLESARSKIVEVRAAASGACLTHLEQLREAFYADGGGTKARELREYIHQAEGEIDGLTAQQEALTEAIASDLSAGRDPSELEVRRREVRGRAADLQERIQFLKASAARAEKESQERLEELLRQACQQSKDAAQVRVNAAKAAILEAIAGPFMEWLAAVAEHCGCTRAAAAIPRVVAGQNEEDWRRERRRGAIALEDGMHPLGSGGLVR